MRYDEYGYEWKGVSKILKSENGWEMVGGSLRRDSSVEAIRIRLHEAGISVNLRDPTANSDVTWAEGSIGGTDLWYYAHSGRRQFFEIYNAVPEFPSDPSFHYEEVADVFGEAGAALELQALRFIEKAVEAYFQLRGDR